MIADWVWDAAPHRGRARSMRKLINAPADVVSDALRGLAAAHPR